MTNYFLNYALVVVLLAGLGCATSGDRAALPTADAASEQAGDAGAIEEPPAITSVYMSSDLQAPDRTDDVETSPRAAADMMPVPVEELAPLIETETVGLPLQQTNGEGARDENTEEPPAAPVEQNYLDTALAYYEESREHWGEGSGERAIEALDQAYMNVLKVEMDEDPELFQQVDDLRFMISKRILEIYASRYTAVNGAHDEIPLIMNDHVKKEIALFQGREREFFLASYRRSGRYRPEIVRALTEAGLPEELSWLPLIESGFKVRALSRARALGLWQFIPSTGYKFGLQRNTWIDDRLNPTKATGAAIAYLQELHRIFGDWTTVLAGYNCGESAVLRKIRRQKINYLDDFWDIYQELPRETARYVPRFLATLHILKAPEDFGFVLPQPDPPIPFDEVAIEKQVHLKDVARVIGGSYDTLKELNPELRHRATPPGPYVIKTPREKGSVLIAKMDQVPRWNPPQRAYARHVVRKGETLSTIARKHRTSVKAIARANNLRSKHFIRIGQKLKIPLRGRGGIAHPEALAELNPDGTYRVRKGDSLWLLSKKFRTSPKEIQRLNGLNSSLLRVGQVLKIRTL